MISAIPTYTALMLLNASLRSIGFHTSWVCWQAGGIRLGVNRSVDACVVIC